MEYISKHFTTSIDENAEIHLIKFTDEDTISLNWIEDGRVTGHHETDQANSFLYRIFQLLPGESITGHGQIITCYSMESEEI